MILKYVNQPTNHQHRQRQWYQKLGWSREWIVSCCVVSYIFRWHHVRPRSRSGAVEYELRTAYGRSMLRRVRCSTPYVLCIYAFIMEHSRANATNHWSIHALDMNRAWTRVLAQIGLAGCLNCYQSIGSVRNKKVEVFVFVLWCLGTNWLVEQIFWYSTSNLYPSR